MSKQAWLVGRDGVPHPIDPRVDASPSGRPYRLYRFLTEVEELLEAAGDPEPRLVALAARVRRLLRDAPWLSDELEPAPVDPGYSIEALYDEPGLESVVQLVAWLAGGARGAHDHGHLALVAVLSGVERHTFWRRRPDGDTGDAGLEQVTTLELGPGSLVALAPDAVHSVEVLADVVSLNLYGASPRSSVAALDAGEHAL
ncbi:MAG: hypothetical protein KC420_00805 [Myxococcales bacterium]|nr:hypothetical protein [Myxococcales bacterium]MCB9568281.1 cupin [Myxococcales bacterium]MCB9705004.1 cupin [Myxococcales bacterium]